MRKDAGDHLTSGRSDGSVFPNSRY